MDEGQNPDYLIFGAGAIGSVIGGFLQKIGRRVVYAGRGEHFRAIKKNGLKITGIWGEHFIPPEKIEAFPGQAAGRKFPVILLCVKSKDTGEAALQAAPALDEKGIMVSVQNGLNNWETVAARVGEARTVGARVIFGAEIPVAGTARVTVSADDVLLGEPFASVNQPLLQALQKDLNTAGISTRVVSREEIWAALWGKVLYNCSLNPLGALLEVPYGALGGSEETRETIRIILREIFSVMLAMGVRVPYRNSDDYYHYLMERQLPPTAGHHASMLQDIRMGRKTEIEALNGAISRYAQELCIPTPYNDLLTALIKFKERPENRRPEGKG